jgi:hypothetical protein
LPPEALLVVPEVPMVTGFRYELIEAAAAPLLAKPRGNIVLGSNGSWLVAAPAAEGERVSVALPVLEATCVLAVVAFVA